MGIFDSTDKTRRYVDKQSYDITTSLFTPCYTICSVSQTLNQFVINKDNNVTTSMSTFTRCVKERLGGAISQHPMPRSVQQIHEKADLQRNFVSLQRPYLSSLHSGDDIP